MTQTAWRFTALILMVLVTACAASVQSVQTDSSVQLRQYSPIIIVLADSTGSLSLNGAAGGGIASGQVMQGEGQAIQALNSLEFEMSAIGFRMTDSLSEAKLVGEFSIGQIRFDPIAGWIADQAILTLKDEAGSTIAMYRARSSLVTPTVNNLVTQLAKAIEQNY